MRTKYFILASTIFALICIVLFNQKHYEYDSNSLESDASADIDEAKTNTQQSNEEKSITTTYFLDFPDNNETLEPTISEQQPSDSALNADTESNQLVAYQLKQTPESIEKLNDYHDVEFCIGYLQVLKEHGSLRNAANYNENLNGTPARQTFARFEGATTRCERFSDNDEEQLNELADLYLNQAAEMGDEEAIFLIASYKASGAFHSHNLLEHERVELAKSALETLLIFSDKGHPDSIGMVALILTDPINLPELYDQDLANELLARYKLLTQTQ